MKRQMTVRENVLSEALLNYERDGVLSPIKVLSPEEVLRFRSAFERQQALAARELRRVDNCHLSFRWAYDIATHPGVLDAVEQILGPDILVHSTRLMVKLPHDPAYVSWHQDGFYSGLNSSPTLSAWIALSNSTIENGCLRVVVGSHLEGVLPQVRTYGREELLNNGEIANLNIDPSRIRDIPLQAGEMSIHHVNMIHGSNPNRSDSKRIGFTISYITPALKSSAAPVLWARGRDDFNHLELVRELPINKDP